MAVKHGIYVYENSTEFSNPLEAENSVQVVIGTAPVHLLDDYTGAVNKPILCRNLADMEENLGFCTDFEKYTLCQTMYITSKIRQVAPIVFINVLDPGTMRGAKVTKTGAAGDQTILLATDVIKSTVVIKQDNITFEKNTDYVLTHDETGKVYVQLIYGANWDPTAAVSIEYYPVTPASVTHTQVIGSYSAQTGVATGSQLVRYVYPRLGVVPSLILAPGYSHIPSVGITLMAIAQNINGVFKAIAVLDIDTAQATNYAGVKSVKDSSGYTSPYCYPVWPCVKIGTYIFAGSAVMAALMAYTDARHSGVPSRSPSNKIISEAGITGTVLASGVEVLLDQDQATTVNQGGVATFLNMSGWRTWGNYTGAYPDATDPKDIWLPVRRMFNWQGNTFILTYFDKVDDPLNQILIESVVDSENIRCAAYAPDHWAGARIQYLKSDNTLADILAGKITFRQWIAPYTPAQEIDNILSYDIEMLEASFEEIA